VAEGGALRARSRTETVPVAHAVRGHVLPLLAKGRVRVPVFATYPLREADTAYERFAEGK
jgi:NADPH:quinone reductase-like Zn-dependent oxidoreductase